jgi:hypothetical protein
MVDDTDRERAIYQALKAVDEVAAAPAGTPHRRTPGRSGAGAAPGRSTSPLKLCARPASVSAKDYGLSRRTPGNASGSVCGQNRPARRSARGRASGSATIRYSGVAQARVRRVSRAVA